MQWIHIVWANETLTNSQMRHGYVSMDHLIYSSLYCRYTLVRLKFYFVYVLHSVSPTSITAREESAKKLKKICVSIYGSFFYGEGQLMAQFIFVFIFIVASSEKRGKEEQKAQRIERWTGKWAWTSSKVMRCEASTIDCENSTWIHDD